MLRFPLVLRLVLMLAVLVSFAGPVSAAKAPAFQTGFVRWRAADDGFAGWTRAANVALVNGKLLFVVQQSTPSFAFLSPFAYNFSL